MRQPFSQEDQLPREEEDTLKLSIPVGSSMMPGSSPSKAELLTSTPPTTPPLSEETTSPQFPSATNSETLPAPDRPGRRRFTASPAWQPWLTASRAILPIYILTHLFFLAINLAIFVMTVPAPLGEPAHVSHLRRVLDAWHRFDTGYFMSISIHGYDDPVKTAFFPFYPILEYLFNFLTHDALISGLIISNLACFGFCVLLYRLVAEDFGAEIGWRTVLFNVLFPTAFFLVAGYNESLLGMLALAAFYNMRRGNWWLAGLFGFLATLTRSGGLVLALPFCYEYLRQHNWNWRAIRPGVLAVLGIPLAVGVFALYCKYRFNDFLAFSHAEKFWGRALEPPWTGFIHTLQILLHSTLISYNAIHNLFDLGITLLIGSLLVLAFVGPWRFSAQNRSYALYGAGIFGLYLLVPLQIYDPLLSMPRYLLEVFPAFIVLAMICRTEMRRVSYLVVSSGLLAFLLMLFLTKQWVA